MSDIAGFTVHTDLERSKQVLEKLRSAGLKSIKLGIDPLDSDLDMKERASTGVEAFDIAMGGGLFPGRVYELYGAESHGKSTLAQLMIASVQREGGWGCLMDSEGTFDRERARILGLDLSRLFVDTPTSLEDGFQKIAHMLKILAEIDSDATKIVVWDTIAASKTKKESDSFMDPDGSKSQWAGGMGEKPRLLRGWLGAINPLLGKANAILILVNQVYDNFDGGQNTPGGGGPKFHASCRIKIFKSKAPIIDEETQLSVGHFCYFKLEKSKQSPALIQLDGAILYDSGFNSLLFAFNYCKARKLIEVKNNGWINFAIGPQEYKFHGELRLNKAAKEDPKISLYIHYLMWKHYADYSGSLGTRYDEKIKDLEERLGIPPVKIDELTGEITT